jgi:molybdopterin-guanine dinucleotide biosynthesis protein A
MIMREQTGAAVGDNAGISVAILAGGQSSRMGSNKALISLGPDGPTLLERVIEATSQLSNDRFIVSRSRDDYPDAGVRVVGDLRPGEGVLGAIATALHAAGNPAVLVVSCDMPFLDPEVLSWMSTIAGRFDAVVPVTDLRTRQGGEQTFQTLHAIYRQSCLPAIQSALRAGDRRTTAFLENVSVRQVSEVEIRRFDPEMLTLLSVNTPEDLQHARAIEHQLNLGD